VLRFPNPGSDVSGYIRIFQALFDELQNSQPFSLDDMTRVMVGRNLATSSGFMGQEALDRSTRADRSRDPFYNQSKAYSELYRILGWQHPQPDNKLFFSFTYLGAHAAAAHRDPRSFFQECLLRIAYPNPLVEVKGDFRLRPFACILRTMLELDDILTRDEMIIGPLCLEDDRDKASFDGMISRLRSIRGNAGHLAKAIAEVSARREITPTTMGNYTRLPMAALPWTGWTTKQRLRVYGKPLVFHVLTEAGKRLAHRINEALDLRAADLTKLSPQVANAFIKLSFYRMLERAGFDVSSLAEELHRYKKECSKHFAALNASEHPLILFSPFQEILFTELQPLFPSVQTTARVTASGKASAKSGGIALAGMAVSSIQVTSHTVDGIANLNKPEVQRLVREFQEAAKSYGGDVSKVVDYFMEKYRNSTQTDFYPLVAHLFCIIGFNCEASRVGVNYQRADAFITDPAKSIPVEIKSPTEERHISVKGVRQALENKTILLSRRSASTTFETSSFVVGYFPPNKRAEVAALISDIQKTFGVRIGVIDFRSLATLAAIAVLQNKLPDKSQLESLCGLINVSDS
jgi:hypothetical protein